MNNAGVTVNANTTHYVSVWRVRTTKCPLLMTAADQPKSVTEQ